MEGRKLSTGPCSRGPPLSHSPLTSPRRAQCYDCSFLSFFSSLSRSSAASLLVIDFLLAVLSEHLTPKRSFSYYALHMVLFSFFPYGHLPSSCVTDYAALSLLLHGPPPFYIRLSLSTENTAWSVHQVFTYLN